jgi:hypothetical protein
MSHRDFLTNNDLGPQIALTDAESGVYIGKQDMQKLERLHNAYLEHETTTKTLHERLQRALSDSSPAWAVTELEDDFMLHNCITAVLREILDGEHEAPNEPF